MPQVHVLCVCAVFLSIPVQQGYRKSKQAQSQPQLQDCPKIHSEEEQESSHSKKFAVFATPSCKEAQDTAENKE